MPTLIRKIIALLLLLAIGPILVILGILIRLTMGRPIFFIQQRIGLHGNFFNIIKFRTMQDNEHITKLGNVMRKFSLDELPQLINILKGEMAFIGPRPLDAAALATFNQQQLARHSVLPGLTGWAQVNGRNNISWQQRVDLDLWYINNRSFYLDCKIIFLTVIKVLAAKDIGTGIKEPKY